MRVLIAVVVLLLPGLAVNAVLVGRAERAAEPFGGGEVLALDGPDLNIRSYGGEGPPIVLLHGYASSIQWWEPVADRLAVATGRRVIAIDLVGHGGSEAPRDAADYGADGQAAAVIEALGALGVEHVALVGHSMGGGVATAVAESAPELVDKVVVVDTYGDAGLKSMPALGEAVCWPLLGPALDRFRAIDAVDKSSLQTGFAPDYPVPEFAYRSLQRLTHTGVCDSTVIDDLNATRPVAERLAGLGRPVLVLWGEHDVLTPTEPNVRRYADAGLAPTVIAGSGHSPMVEKPDEFLAAVTPFLR
ncbi:hypothetical protein MBRU_10250 [Mycolicibacterium brumae DSM 44177]|nr:hypothetical protein MBRU_10250 [Mycolicibacterium brumae DSM 44177]